MTTGVSDTSISYLVSQHSRSITKGCLQIDVLAGISVHRDSGPTAEMAQGARKSKGSGRA